MGECIRLEYEVDGENFASAGHASESVKRTLKQMGVSPASVRRVSIAMYEGEINMVIHAHGGRALAEIYPDRIDTARKATGPGIAADARAMRAGSPTATENILSLGFGAGMGLPNMKKYSDEMKTDTAVGVGTTVFLGICF